MASGTNGRGKNKKKSRSFLSLEVFWWMKYAGTYFWRRSDNESGELTHSIVLTVWGNKKSEKTPFAHQPANQEHPHMLTIFLLFHLKKLEYQMCLLDTFLRAGIYFCEIKKEIHDVSKNIVPLSSCSLRAAEMLGRFKDVWHGPEQRKTHTL